MQKVIYIIDGQSTGAIDNVPVNKLKRFGSGSGGGSVINALNVKGYVDEISDLDNIVDPQYGDVYIVVNEDNAWWVYVKDYNNIPGNDKWIDSGMKIDLSLYAMESWVDANYISKTLQNTFLTSSSLNGYATENFVTSQGYLNQSALNLALANYVTTGTLTSQYYTKTQSDTRFVAKAGLTGTGNRLVQAQPDGTLVPVVVGSLPPDRVLGYDSLNNPTAFQAKAYKSTWVGSTAPTISELNAQGTDIVDAPNVGTGRQYVLCDTIWTYINLTVVV